MSEKKNKVALEIPESVKALLWSDKFNGRTDFWKRIPAINECILEAFRIGLKTGESK